MISFVIPAHNEAQLIGATLQALHAAAVTVGEPYEIIVAADACTDRTVEIAEAHGVRVVQVHNRQIAATRNAGAREATGEILFFVDADTLANPAAIRSGIRALRRGAVGGGCVFYFDGWLPLWARLIYPIGVLGMRMLHLVGGCFLFCTREAFESVGGFSEKYYAAEEAAFIASLKRQGRFVVPTGYVTTSGRKLRTFSTREATGILLRWAVGGPESFQQREGLEMWYGERNSGGDEG